MSLEAGPSKRETPRNIDDYEREKIETTVKELRLAANTLENALKMLDFASEKGIEVVDRQHLDSIRRDPNGSIMRGVTDALSLGQKLQTDLAAHIPVKYKAELESRLTK